ncbi:MAG: hypothetical protein C0618_00440 [Desulfuromonas sp.]|nr:MAG: hypothetical protein C0618_00440 [Desulfuromonas sp.]
MGIMTYTTVCVAVQVLTVWLVTFQALKKFAMPLMTGITIHPSVCTWILLQILLGLVMTPQAHRPDVVRSRQVNVARRMRVMTSEAGLNRIMRRRDRFVAQSTFRHSVQTTRRMFLMAIQTVHNLPVPPPTLGQLPDDLPMALIAIGNGKNGSLNCGAGTLHQRQRCGKKTQRANQTAQHFQPQTPVHRQNLPVTTPRSTCP